jgi:hypothetical protein
VLAAAVLAVPWSAAAAHQVHRQELDASTTDHGTVPVTAPQVRPRADDTPLERKTGLHVTIDSVEPTTLTPGEPLAVTGAVQDTGRRGWPDAQVYLEITTEPATTRAGLEAFATTTEDVGERIIEFGLFDELGRLKPSETTPYELSVPFQKLPISRAPGVYHVGVVIIATDRDGTRAQVARADTLVPLLPDRGPDGGPLSRTPVVTMIPLAAPVRRVEQNHFLDDDLAAKVAFGGQLRNLLDFVAAAPADTLEVVLDPALRDAVADMADGYKVRSLAEYENHEPGHDGPGETDAQQWLAELDEAVRHQDLLFMPWGSPDANALGSHRLLGVVESAVRASQRYASDQRITTAVASWPYAGASTRRGLVASALSGAPLRVVSQNSLVGLRDEDDETDPAYPPSQIVVRSTIGNSTALVTRADVAGRVIETDTPGQEFLRDIVAETSVRSLEGEPGTTVFAAPFGWDPGLAVSPDELVATYGFRTVQPITAARAAQEPAAMYLGRIAMPRGVSQLSIDLMDSIRELGRRGRTYADLLTDHEQTAPLFDQVLAAAGTSLWRDDDQARIFANDRNSRVATRELRRVRVTGPTFVALSSASGRFPLTITNGLAVSVTVQVVARAANPAVTIDPIERLVLDPGQRRDIEVTARSKGSGLTGVRVRLMTTTSRPVGRAWNFSIRSTQLGTAIWVVMGVGAAILFTAAARRIYLRVKEGRLHTREEPQR